MQVILLERVENLGAIGDVVTVKAGYARNFLLPGHKALRATDANMTRFAAQRAEIEARNAALREKAAVDGQAIDGKSYVLIRQAGDSGQLYGSVSARDLAEIIIADGHEVARNVVQMEKPIKSLGVYPVKVRLHPELVVGITINVARSQDEADRQAKGENVIAANAAADRAESDARNRELAAVAAEAAADRGPGEG